MFATKNLLAGEGDRESDLLDKGGVRVAGRGDIFLTGYDIGNNETPTLGFLNNKNANPFQCEADEQARQQQQQQQQQQLLHASSESVDTKEGL